MKDKRILTDDRLHECKLVWDRYKNDEVSTRKLADELNVSHSTVQRRFQAYEDHLDALREQQAAQKEAERQVATPAGKAAPAKPKHNGDYQYSSFKPDVQNVIDGILDEQLAMREIGLTTDIKLVMKAIRMAEKIGKGEYTTAEIVEALLSDDCGKRNSGEQKLKDASRREFEGYTERRREEDNRRILIISDLHAPYQHPDALAFLKALQGKYLFTRHICTGDELDFHAMSFHDSDPDLDSAGLELEKGRRVMWELEKLFPNLDLAYSNHGSMTWRKAKHGGFPRHLILSYRNSVFGERLRNGDVIRPQGRGDGWTWYPQIDIRLPNGQILTAVHGYSTNIRLAVQKSGQNVVQGHYHTKFEIAYCQGYGQNRFGITGGCLIDDRSLAFEYNKLQPERPFIGCSGVLDSIPVLFPMPLDSNGRWTGQVP
ncbi:hypothetical protein [Azospirillum brasilense]|uniref:hypothetical protein n=1 Tax=Azospirillum brasilense TaxID=192 RepID=UPI000E6A46FA|nr:hypothetical protein [Azospirillum brasilense]NUB24702.1 hypothetical protein [Azospirillum brasilense]NUB30694.1 hypothetical protein [Azospirillum brasilense]RIW08303.1 hypothetical protein D2T81_00910 [Azospirillum brasilense]